MSDSERQSSSTWGQAEQGGDAAEAPSRVTGVVLAENLQPQPWALDPLFITFYTE